MESSITTTLFLNTRDVICLTQRKGDREEVDGAYQVEVSSDLPAFS